MNKLEAWKAWCQTAGTESLADEFTLEKSSHGKAFSFAWGAAHEACAAMAEAFHRHQYDFTGDLELHEAIRARGDKT